MNMNVKSKVLAAAILAATGLLGVNSSADAAVANPGAAIAAKSAGQQAATPAEQVKGRRGGGFRVRHGRFHRHYGHKHRHWKHYGYYPYYYSYGSDCYWVKKWRHGHLRKYWVCH